MGDFAYSVPPSTSRPGTANGPGDFSYGRPAGSGDLLPPGSSGGLNIGYAGGYPSNGPPGSAHGIASKPYHSHEQQPPQSASSNLWGYTAPSPPPTAQSVISNAGPPPLGHSTEGQIMYGYHGYNTSNTRPMTAPTTSANGPSYYHGGPHGQMFSPATYSGAGFPHNLAGRAVYNGQPARQPYETAVYHHNMPVPGSAGSMAGNPPTSAHSIDVFAHQPPPIQSTSAGLPPQYHQNYYHRPGTDYAARRTLDSLNEAYRPGTSDTIRPDTGISAYSSYSSHAPQIGYPGSGMPGGPSINTLPMQNGPDLTHPSYYNMAAQASSSPVEPTSGHTQRNQEQQSWSFVPMPNQPKKRPRRRFEEIERLYDCNYPGCNKAYGTLNHLNAHVSMQKHGPKRVPSEFKEVRKAWRQRKKESEAAAAAYGDDDGDNGRRRNSKADQNEEEDEGDDVQAYSTGYPQSHQQEPQHAQQASSHDPQPRHTYPPPHPHSQEITPPNSTHFPSQPSFAQYPGFAQFPQGQPGNHPYNNAGGHYPATSPGSYGRPSTAPSHSNHYSFGSNGGTPVLPSSTNGHHASPVGVAFPSGYNPSIRKQSITSIPPAFASIQEEEPSAAEGGDVFSQFKEAQKLSTSSHPPANVEGFSHPGHSLIGLPISPNNLEPNVQANGAVRPHTASSPFRFSANSTAEGAYDTLDIRRTSSQAGVISNAMPAPAGEIADRPLSGVIGNRHWTPGSGQWSSASQELAYKQEIR